PRNTHQRPGADQKPKWSKAGVALLRSLTLLARPPAPVLVRDSISFPVPRPPTKGNGMTMRTTFGPVLALLLCPALSFADEAETVRVIVRVAPADLGRRARDERPAEFRLAAPDVPANRRLDPASLRV